MTQSLSYEPHRAQARRRGLPGLVEQRSRPFTVDGVDQKLISCTRPLLEVEPTVPAGVDWLARRRRFPLFG